VGAIAGDSTEVYAGWRNWLVQLEGGQSDALYEEDLFSQAMAGTVTSATTTTLTDSAAQWMTDGGGMLMNTTLTVFDPTSEDSPISYRIVSNTATTLTIEGTFTATPSAGWTYWLGAIEGRWTGPRMGTDRWDGLKRWDRLRVVNVLPPTDTSETVTVRVRVNDGGTSDARVETFSMDWGQEFHSFSIAVGKGRNIRVEFEDTTPTKSFDVAGFSVGLVDAEGV